MLVGQAIILNAVPVKGVFRQGQHLGTQLLVGLVGRQETDVLHLTAQLLCPCCGRLLQTLLRSCFVRVVETVAADTAGIEHGESRHRLDALVCLGAGQGVPAASADAEGTDA